MDEIVAPESHYFAAKCVAEPNCTLPPDKTPYERAVYCVQYRDQDKSPGNAEKLISESEHCVHCTLLRHDHPAAVSCCNMLRCVNR